MSNKIDAMVAEKVMGWVEMDRHTAYRDTHNYELTGWWHRPNGETTQRSERFGDEMPWSPSTDISAAWEVVEEWGVLPWNIDNGWREKDGERISGVTCKVTTHTGSFEATEKDAPLAICVCALRAKGVPESAIQEALQ